MPEVVGPTRNRRLEIVLAFMHNGYDSGPEFVLAHASMKGKA